MASSPSALRLPKPILRHNSWLRVCLETKAWIVSEVVQETCQSRAKSNSLNTLSSQADYGLWQRAIYRSDQLIASGGLGRAS